MANYSQIKMADLKLNETIFEDELTDTEAEKVSGGNIKNELLASGIFDIKKDIKNKLYANLKNSTDPPCDDDPPPQDPIKPPLGC